MVILFNLQTLQLTFFLGKLCLRHNQVGLVVPRQQPETAGEVGGAEGCEGERPVCWRGSRDGGMFQGSGQMFLLSDSPLPLQSPGPGVCSPAVRRVRHVLPRDQRPAYRHLH